MQAEPLPQSDRVEGAPHPRETLALYGHSAVEMLFLEAFNAGHLHHAWLLTGPEGIGKATLCWRLARFLLTQPVVASGGDGLFGDDMTPPTPDTLDVEPGHPVAQRLLALSEPRLKLLRRTWDFKKEKPFTAIRID